MKIKELMTQPVITVPESASLEEAARSMLENGIGGLPVIDPSGKLTGIVTESNFAAKDAGIPFSTFRAPKLLGRWLSEAGIDKIYSEARNTPVKDIMTKDVVCVSVDDPLSRAVELMLAHDINRVPVVENGVPIGIVARRDLLKLLTK
ncbi:MAG TPA: CBS domain-containing protein [Pyrinomonadaceae bacterium]|nr:CBS domain-containing protein [Pyrinomonadaceae bacterium]